LTLVAATTARAGWGIGVTPNGAAEATAGAAPVTPTGVASACTSPLAATVTVSWNAAAHATSYTIWESKTSATSGYAVAAAGVTGTSWTSGNLATGSWWFEVSASVGSNWVSPNSTATAQRTILLLACN